VSTDPYRELIVEAVRRGRNEHRIPCRVKIIQPRRKAHDLVADIRRIGRGCR
jgi:hypothetical protein